MPEQYDLIIRGGTVFDGSGAAGVRADLGVRADRIATVGAVPEDATARETLDATGLAVAPGFIDVHAHDDALVFLEPDVTGKSMQGVTTVVNGNCGAGVVPYGGIARWGDAGVRRSGTRTPGTSRRSSSARRRSTSRCSSDTGRCARARWAAPASGAHRPKTRLRGSARGCARAWRRAPSVCPPA
jgi:hypothetical protein